MKQRQPAPPVSPVAKGFRYLVLGWAGISWLSFVYFCFFVDK